ncbi:phospholipase A2 inhibitor and Ly6/PLAUR domain-containing protein-like [Mantella aurantiaca]
MHAYFLLFTSVLSVLYGACHSLSCVECKDTSESCTGPVVPCPNSDQICMSAYTITSVGGIPVSKMFMRECGDRSSCNRAGSFSIPNGQVQTSATCCNVDGCTPGTPVLPPLSSKKNGVVCTACISTTVDSCQASTFIECTGNEVKCMAQGTVSKGSLGTIKSAVRGCATKELCEVTHVEGSFGDITITTEVTCTDGCTGLPYSLSLLLPTAGLILKLFY